MNRLKHVNKCRICGGELTSILDLGNQYLQGSFCRPDRPEPSHRKIPLNLMWCDTTKTEDACGAVQLSKTIPPYILYDDYWYVSATTKTMRDHLKSIVEYITDLTKNVDGYDTKIGGYDTKFVLDIAANDGTLLSYYNPMDYKRYAIDPSNIVETISDDSITVIKDFFPSSKIFNDRFDIITSIAVLYDLDDPMSFIEAIRNSLTDNGVWVFEMSYLPSMLEANAFDTVCGEHIFYYSLSVIEFLLHYCGLKLINATLNDINGGSVQCTAVKEECDCYPINNDNLNKLRTLEFNMKLDEITPYVHFKNHINILIEKLRLLILKLKREGKTIHLYGASTKGNTLLQSLNIDNINELIPYAAERTPKKWGAKTLGTNISIISEEESRGMKPDYYLVLPWHFKKEFIERERETILSGTNFIFPLPNLEIITKDNI